jgi:hypothetical protein
VTEQELLVDALRRLNRAEAPYMLTGSMASNYWGIPRATHVLDFVIQLPGKDIPKMVEAFQQNQMFSYVAKVLNTRPVRIPRQAKC